MPKKPEPWWRKERQAWFVQIDRKRFNLGRDKKQAWKRYYELMAEPAKRVVVAESLVVIVDTFLEWVQKHRAADTYEWYRFRLERFARTYPALRTNDLRPFHVQQWIDGMDVSSGTKRNYCRAVKRCLRWAKQQGYIDHNPIADMELPKGGKRETVISADEWAKVLSLVTDSSFRDLIITTWETGCRPQESLRVEARHVDLLNQRWVIPESESKTDTVRVIYLTDQALEITKRLMLQNPQGKLFCNSHGRPWTTNAVNCAFTRIQIALGRQICENKSKEIHNDRRRKYVAVDNAVAFEFVKSLNPFKQSGDAKSPAELLSEARRKLTHKAARKVGPKYSLYVIRHTWMNRMLMKGVDALTVAILAGHKDPGTLAKVYQHLALSPEHMLVQAKRAAG